jgi:hypothetical protein
MPKGPGPRQRRATKIANRSHVTPFDKLAQWNAEIMKLGTQGAVPSIVGNSLEFVKLKASDIPGVMNNPATANLVMNQWDILFSANGNISMTNGEISGVQNLNGGSSGNLTLDASTSINIGNGSLGSLDLNSIQTKITGTTLLDLEGTQIYIDAGVTGLQLGSDGGVTIDAVSEIEIDAGGRLDLSGNQIDIDAGANGLQLGSDAKVTIDAVSDIEIDAGGRLDLSGNQIYIDSDGVGGVNISSATDITMDAANVDMEATTKLDLSGNQMTIHSSNNLEIKAGATLDLSSTNLNAIAGSSNLSMSDLATVLSTKTTTFNATGVITLDAPLNATGGIRLKVGSSSSTQLALSAVGMQIISPEIKIGTSNSKVDISGETTIHDLIAEDISCNKLFTGVFIDLSNNKTNTGRFTLQDTNTGVASNKVINAKSSSNQVLFGGYDYTDGAGIIGNKKAIDRVIINLEAGSSRFDLNVADSGSVIRTLGGIKILPLQSNTNGNPPNYVAPGWGSSLFLGEWGWGNQAWNNQLTKRLSQRTVGQNFPGSGNVYCNTIRQNIIYSSLNAQGPTFNQGYQGYASTPPYYNQGDIRYIFISPNNGSNNFCSLILPPIYTPMLGQAITVVRVNVPPTYTNYKAAVLIKATIGDKINCPNSIFVNDNNFGGIALDPFYDLSGAQALPNGIPNPYKSTDICSVTLVASKNGYYVDAPQDGNPGGGAITTQFVWQFISSGGPGV